MKAAGFTDFERGIEGSTAEHLDVLEYKVKQDRQAVQELRQEIGDLGTQAEEARNSGMNCAARLQPQQATYGSTGRRRRCAADARAQQAEGFDKTDRAARG